MITSILGGLNGRRVELVESMSKLAKPETVKQELDSVFEELKVEKVNKKLLSVMGEAHSGKDTSIGQESKGKSEPSPTKYDTLYDFVNEESVRKLVSEAGVRYQQLEVSPKYWIILLVFEERARNKPGLPGREHREADRGADAGQRHDQLELRDTAGPLQQDWRPPRLRREVSYL